MDKLGPFDLRPHQIAAIEAITREMDRGREAAMAVLPTGAGKTVIAVAVARDVVVDWRRRVLIVVNRKELVGQWTDTIRRVDPTLSVSQVGDGRADWSGQVVVAMVQSLTPERLRGRDRHMFGLLIFDECHRSATTQSRYVRDFFQAEFYLGLTATPIRGDDVHVGQLYCDTVCYLITLRQLILLGELVDAVGWRVSTDIDVSDVPRTPLGDFELDELERRVNVERRNRAAVAAYREYAHDPARGHLHGIAFTAGILHADACAELFTSSGISAVSIHTKMPKAVRRERTAHCRAGQHLMTSNIDVLTEGFDAAVIKAVLLLRPLTPVSARVLYAQMAGRALRLWKDDDGNLIVDHAVIIELVDTDTSDGTGRRRDNLVESCGIFAADLDGADTNGRRITDVGREADANRRKRVVDAVLAQMRREQSLAGYLPPRSVAGVAERTDVIHRIESYTGMLTHCVAGSDIVACPPDSEDRRRIIEVRSVDGLYTATLKTHGLPDEHVSAGFDRGAVFESVGRYMEARRIPKVFADPNHSWYHEPCTPRQRSYLASLLRVPACSLGEMTRGDASARITILEAAREGEWS